MDNHDILLRKYEDNLNVCGIGVIMFGAWGVLKIVMQVFANASSEIINIFNEIKDHTDRFTNLYFIVVILMMILILTLIIAPVFLLHMYIGLNASRAAKGLSYKKRLKLHLMLRLRK